MNLKELFFRTLRIRKIEEAIADRYPEGKMRCPVHLSIGQEAVAVGVAAHLRQEDAVLSTHRAHAHYLARGGNLKKMLAELYGKKTGCCAGRGGSMHLTDLSVGFIGSTPIVGGSFPVAVGVAAAYKMQKKEGLTALFFGEAMTEEGVFSEGINFAALKKLPLLLICESNLYSVYSPMEVRQPDNRDLPAIVRGHGIPAVKGNGNDPEEVFSLTKEAVQKIRNGEGPQFIELETYRFREHCGPGYDIELGYRSQTELDERMKQCPVETTKEFLLREKILLPEETEREEHKIRKEIEEAFLFAEQSPDPDPEDLLLHVEA